MGGAAAIGTGVVLSKSFKRVRMHVPARQQQSKALTAGQDPAALPAAELDENGTPITDVIVIEVQVVAAEPAVEA
jgi:hypothetical protein